MKILVVDDERIVADSTALVFKRFGHTAKAVYDAETAIGFVKTFEPQLVVADVNMVGVNGLDLAIRLCIEVPDCKLLLVSGQADTAELLEEARRRGYEFEILAKPVAPSELVGKAMEMMGASLNHDALRPKFTGPSTANGIA